MLQLTIRGLEDKVIERLRRRAKLNNHSLEAELREILAASVEPRESDKLDHPESGPAKKEIKEEQQQSPEQILSLPIPREQHVTKFIELYKEKFGKEISREDAFEQLSNLAGFMYLTRYHHRE